MRVTDWMTLGLCLVMFAACGEDDTDTAEPTDFSDTAETDLDDDGWESPDDCDDTNALVNPDASEDCDDGIDNDCDDLVDDEDDDCS